MAHAATSKLLPHIDNEDQSVHSDSSTVQCSNVRRVTLSPLQSRDTMAEKVSHELTQLWEMISVILDRAQPNQYQGLIAVLNNQFLFYQAESEEQDSSLLHRASMVSMFPGLFDGHDFPLARELTRKVNDYGEFKVLLERLKGWVPAGRRLSSPIPENAASERGEDSKSAIFRSRSQGSSSPVPENITNGSSTVSSSLTMHISSDGSTQKSGSPVKKGDADMAKKMDDLLLQEQGSGGVIFDHASFDSDRSTAVDSSMVTTNSDGGAVASGADATGICTGVERAIQGGDQVQEQETSNTGSVTAAENEMLFGEEEGNDSRN